MGFEDDIQALRAKTAHEDSATSNEELRAAALRPEASKTIENTLRRAVALLRDTPEVHVYRGVKADIRSAPEAKQRKRWRRPTPVETRTTEYEDLGRGWFFDGQYFLDEHARIWSTARSNYVIVQRSLSAPLPRGFTSQRANYADFVRFMQGLPSDRYPEGSRLFVMRPEATPVSTEPNHIMPVAASRIYSYQQPVYRVTRTPTTPEFHHFAVMANGQVGFVCHSYDRDIGHDWTIKELELWLKHNIAGAMNSGRRS